MNTAFETVPFAIGMPGPGELLIIFGILLLLFGARKLPEFARGLGKSITEFKKAQKEIEDEINTAGEPEKPMTTASDKAPSPDEKKDAASTTTSSTSSPSG